jgi:hypothetical protein
VKIEITIPDEMISNLLCSAFEGGSNYWLRSAGTVEAPSGVFDRTTAPLEPGGKVSIVLQEEAVTGKGVKYTLDRDAILRGIVAMREKAPKHFGDALAENDDAETGDVFLQCCLFGEVVYA